ncbi:MAG: hypothetical protein V8Q16_05595 [Akkermansia muciniphila]
MPTKACAATHAWSSTVMGAEIRAWAGSEMSWEAVQRKAPWEMTAWFPDRFHGAQISAGVNEGGKRYVCPEQAEQQVSGDFHGVGDHEPEERPVDDVPAIRLRRWLRE